MGGDENQDLVVKFYMALLYEPKTYITCTMAPHPLSASLSTAFSKACEMVSNRSSGSYNSNRYTVEPRLTDTCDNSECPDCISIDCNIFKPPQQRTPRYSV